MKQILVSLLLFMGIGQTLFAQADTLSNHKKRAATKENVKKSSTETSSQQIKSTDPKTSGSETKKDGTPDMRFKKNKDASKQTPVSTSKTATTTTTTPPVVDPAQPAPPASTVKTSTSTSANTTKVSDKMIGTDEKGRTIYEGTRGGRYYINKNGNKEYIKKSN